MERDMLFREIRFLDNEARFDDEQGQLWLGNSASDFEQSLPSFDVLWKNYPFYSTSAKDLYTSIGGQFARNALDRSGEVNASYGNTCSIRISHTLNLSGFPIKNYPKLKILLLKSAAKKNYIIRVRDLHKYLRQTLGTPIYKKFKGSESLADRMSAFDNIKGIIMFSIPYKDATGHFTLWNGSKISGGSHYQSEYFLRAQEIRLWQLT